MPSPSDLVKFSIEEKPHDLQNAFADLMIDKIRAEIEIKKAEVATEFFNQANDPEDVEDAEDDDYEDSDDVDAEDEDDDASIE